MTFVNFSQITLTAPGCFLLSWILEEGNQNVGRLNKLVSFPDWSVVKWSCGLLVAMHLAESGRL